MIIKGYAENIKSYSGKVYIGAPLRLLRTEKKLMLANQKSIGELDEFTSAMVDLYLPFIAEISIAATDLHNGEWYPIEINIIFKP